MEERRSGMNFSRIANVGFTNKRKGVECWTSHG
jgi:hypothetical protein